MMERFKGLIPCFSLPISVIEWLGTFHMYFIKIHVFNAAVAESWKMRFKRQKYFLMSIYYKKPFNTAIPVLQYLGFTAGG